MEVSEDLCFISSRWWFQICLFSPLPGEMIQINKCFSNGLVQPPPSLGYHTQQRVFFVYSVQFLRVTVARKKNPWCFSVGENRETGKGGAPQTLESLEAKLTYCGAQGSLTCIRPIEEGEVRGGSTFLENSLFGGENPTDHQGNVPFFVPVCWGKLGVRKARNIDTGKSRKSLKWNKKGKVV